MTNGLGVTYVVSWHRRRLWPDGRTIPLHRAMSQSGGWPHALRKDERGARGATLYFPRLSTSRIVCVRRVNAELCQSRQMRRM